MTFLQSIERITPATSTGVGKGLTVSLVKALTHASVIRATDATEYAKMSTDVRKAELAAIAEHLSEGILLSPPAASAEFNDLLTHLREAGKAVASEGPDWTEKDTRSNLAALSDRIITICGKMDAELGGITDAAAGDKL